MQEETWDHGLIDYTCMRWGEFLEFICRLAYLKFKGTPKENVIELLDKVKSVLDDILPLVGAKRYDPPSMNFVISESDDDY